VRFSGQPDDPRIRGAGIVVALCRAGGFVAITTPHRPALGTALSLELLGFGDRAVGVAATIVAHTSDGAEFAIAIDEAGADFHALLGTLSRGETERSAASG
jgi:hypothetical protein